MTRFTMSLLLALLLAGAVWAEEAVRASVRYDGRAVEVIWKNLTDKPLTLQYDSLIITKVTSSTGIAAARILWPDVMISRLQLPAQGQGSITLRPGQDFLLEPGEGYFVELSLTIAKTNTPISFTFPFIMPRENPVFFGAWREIITGLKARLVVTLFPKERISEVRVEYKNEGGRKYSVSRIPFLDHAVLQLGEAVKETPLKPDKVIGKEWDMDHLETISLPGFATIGLPTAQANIDPIPEDRISLWLHYKQYLLKPGEEYLIDSSVLLPVADKKVNARLAPVHITVPKADATKVDSPVQVSFQYDENFKKGTIARIFFTDTSDHDMAITGDEVKAVDNEGQQPSFQGMSDFGIYLLGIPRNAIIPAKGSFTFDFAPEHWFYRLLPYNFTALVKLEDKVTREKYTISADFPFVLRPSYPTFTGEWTPVKERPGLEMRMRVTVWPLGYHYRTWNPTTWLEYRNVGERSVSVYDYPELKPKMADSKGKEPVTGKRFELIPANPPRFDKIEELQLTPGSSLIAPSVHSYQSMTNAPKDSRFALFFDGLIFALADGDRYTLEGTVKLPGDEKGKDIFAPFAPVSVLVPAK